MATARVSQMQGAQRTISFVQQSTTLDSHSQKLSSQNHRGPSYLTGKDISYISANGDAALIGDEAQGAAWLAGQSPRQGQPRRPRHRAGAGGSSLSALSPPVALPRLPELDRDAPVVVRERTSPPPDRPSSRLGKFLSDTKESTKVPSPLRRGADARSRGVGVEEVVRPLSALLKRPGSRSGSRDRGGAKEEADRPPSRQGSTRRSKGPPPFPSSS